MRQRPINKGQIPYGGGWKVNRPDLGIVGGGTTWKHFLKSARAYRIANDLPIGLDFERECENAACQSHPKECQDDNPYERISPRRLGYADVVVGTKVMFNMAASGFQIVPHEEAERRASMCAKCPLNVEFAKPCGGLCGALMAMLKTVTQRQPTQYDGQLKACFICGCFLEAAVHFPLEIQFPPLSDEQKIRFKVQFDEGRCWKYLPT